MSLSFRKTPLFVPLAFTGLAATSSLHAVDFVWDGSDSNDWATPSNWVGNAVPNGTDIRINVGGTGAVNIPWANRLVYSATQGATTIGSATSRGLFIANGSGTVGNVEITGGTLTSVSTSTDGMANGGGNATLVLNGGTYSKIVADSATGTFSLNYGVGTSLLDINSGAFQVTRLDFQENVGDATTTGVIQLDGGTLSVGRFLKTNTASSTTQNVYLNGGTVEARLTNVTWADLAGVTWTLQSKSTFNIATSLSVAFAEALGGVGGFDKTGAGNFTLTGANTYTGVTTVAGGNLVAGSNGALGANGAGNGTIVSSGARVSLNNGVTITGESISITGDGGSNGALQAAAGATGTWDGAVTTTGPVRIGSQTGGNLIINGNIDATAGIVTVRSVGSNGSTEPDINNFNSTFVTLGGTYTGTQLVLFQGIVKLGASDRIQDTTVMTFGTGTSSSIKQRFDLNGYNETVAAVIVSGSATSDTHEITNSSPTTSTLTVNNSTARDFSGVITGNLNFQKLGSNAVTFSGINTYTGTTSVGAGTLNVSTVGQMNGGGSTLVASGATFNMLGIYAFNIGNNGVNNSISGAGSINLTGTINLNLASAAIAQGNSWQIVDADGSINWTGLQVTSTAGNFTRNAGVWSLAEGGREWSFSESSGILELIAVPEPSQITLLMAGLAGLASRRRRSA